MKHTLRDKKVWSGAHLGIGFEIQHWITPANEFDHEREHWTYYIFVHLDRIPEEYKPNSFFLKGTKNGSFISYKYYDHPILSQLDFHGGITWYSKERGFDGDAKVIKIGCDYQHYWDEGKKYSIDYVLYDVKRTIEDFREKIPDYKYWCTGNGKLYNLSDGILKDETFYSREYFGDKEWFKDELKQLESQC